MIFCKQTTVCFRVIVTYFVHTDLNNVDVFCKAYLANCSINIVQLGLVIFHAVILSYNAQQNVCSCINSLGYSPSCIMALFDTFNITSFKHKKNVLAIKKNKTYLKSL